MWLSNDDPDNANQGPVGVYESVEIARLEFVTGLGRCQDQGLPVVIHSEDRGRDGRA